MRNLALIGAFISLVAVSTAGAQPVQAGAPAPGSTVITFNSLARFTPIANQWSPAVIVSSSCFMTDNIFNAWFAGDPMQAINFDASGLNCNGGNVYPTVTFSFSSAISYFGLMGISLSDLTLTNANGGVTVNASATNPSATFVGLNDAAGFSWVTVSAGLDGSMVVDDVSFGATVIATPEPATLVLFATGMLAVGVAVKRKDAKA
jgi:hypothetical protein